MFVNMQCYITVVESFKANVLWHLSLVTLIILWIFFSYSRPIVLSIDADSAFEANFVLATLAESQSQTGNSSNATTQQRTAR